jgi:hypothetical protein
MPITPKADGRHNWPNGRYSVPVLLDVNEEWIAAAFGHPLIVGIDERYGSFIAVAGTLPSGEWIEAGKHTGPHGGETFEFRIREKKTENEEHAVLQEFRQATGLDAARIIWPYRA